VPSYVPSLARSCDITNPYRIWLYDIKVGCVPGCAGVPGVGTQPLIPLRSLPNWQSQPWPGILIGMSERYFVDQPLAVGPVGIVGPEAHHLAVVCRVRAGDRVYLFNGDGRQYQATIAEAGKRGVRLDIDAVEEPSRELGFRLELAAPLPKGDRGQFLIEKLTELGATEFVPLRTARSVVHPKDIEKLRRYVIEASKQCGRNVLMRVAPVTEWHEYASRRELPSLRLLAHPGGQAIAGGDRTDVTCAVGPEGGFTEEEVALAQGLGWRIVSLGSRTLRVETAALVLAARFSLA
jgi:16S rRNA (uracil1498-N3)-methyltransferase